MQVCIICKKEKPMISFSFSKRDGLSNTCTTCQTNKSRRIAKECPEFDALEQKKHKMFNPRGSRKMETANGKKKNSTKDGIFGEKLDGESKDASLIGKKFISIGEHDNKKQKKKGGGCIEREPDGRENGYKPEDLAEGEV